MTTHVLPAQVRAKQVPAQSSQQCIAAFMARASFETTRPMLNDIEALRAVIAPKTPIYVSAVPRRELAAQIDVAVRLAAAGFEPVPHIAARRFASGAELDRHLGRHGPFDLVVVADGAHSAVRRRLMPDADQKLYPWGCIWATAPDRCTTPIASTRTAGRGVPNAVVPEKFAVFTVIGTSPLSWV